MNMTVGNVSYAAMFLLGLFGSLAHCLGMCVPLVLMMQARFGGAGRGGSAALLAGTSTPLPALALRYHGARIAVYAVLGALAGLVGAMVTTGLRLGGIASVASIVFGLAVIFFGLANLGVALPRPVRVSGTWLVKPMRSALALPPLSGSLAAGALNGLLPCPLVYAALVMAASLGSPIAGAAGMALFGAGTLPLLLAAGLGARAWQGRVRFPWARAAGALVVLVGLQLILRGVAGMGVVPHGSLGGVALW